MSVTFEKDSWWVGHWASARGIEGRVIILYNFDNVCQNTSHWLLLYLGFMMLLSFRIVLYDETVYMQTI